MQGYFRFVLRHRIAVLLFCLLVTVVAGLSMSRAIMASSLGRLVLGDSAAYQRYVDLAAFFGGDEQLIIGLEGIRLDSEPEMEKLHGIVERVEAIDEVRNVDSILNATRLQYYLDAAVSEDPVSIRYITMATNPLASGLVVSPDARKLALVVNLEPDETRPLERTPAIVGDVLEIFRDAGFSREDIHLGGMLAVLAEVQTQTRRNIFRLTPIVAILLLATTWLLFRRLWPVLVTVAVGALAIVWTMGFAIALDRQVNVMLAICPALILIISFSDVVHLCSAYLLELSAGKDKDEAILQTASDVGKACLYTSLTTLIGFLCLSLVQTPAFRQAGIVLGFGVAVALLLAMTLVPIMFSFMKAPRPWTTRSRHVVDVVLHGVQRAATTRPWLVIGAFAVFVAGSIYGASRITIETDLASRFSERNLLRRDVEFFKESLAGTSMLELFIEIDRTQMNAEFLEAAGRFEDELAALPEVDKVLSLLDVLRAIAVADPESPQGGTWVTGSVLATYMHVARSGAAFHLNRLFLPGEVSILRFLVFSPETGMHAMYELGEKAVAMSREHLAPEIPVEATGLMYLAGQWLEENVRSQRRAILISFAMICLVMIILFRSPVTGLWSMVPNVVPLLALGGALGVFWKAVDSDIAVVALIAIGIAVDDTIHFLTRSRLETRRTESTAQALDRTFSTAGRAIVMTSLIFAVGFAPFAFSDYLSIRMIGILLPFVMLVALAADLLLLPALITVGALRLGR